MVAKIVAMRKTLKIAIQAKTDNLIIESNSQLLINSIIGKTKVPSQFVNLVNDILLLVRNFRNIQFIYCKRAANRMTDKIAKSAHCTFNGLCKYSNQ